MPRTTASKRPEYWKSGAVLWFLKKTKRTDPEEAVGAEAHNLLCAASMSGPPFVPQRVAALRRVTRITRARIPTVSQLVPSKEGFVIVLRERNSTEVMSTGRDAFSIAHEIGHTLFYDLESPTPTRPHGDLGSAAEERLCDIFASELLMPAPRFARDACALYEQRKNWCDVLFELKTLYRVSMRAVAERVVGLRIVEDAVIIRWRWKPKVSTGSDVRLRVDWSVPLKNGKHYFIWPDKPAPEGSIFVRASLGDVPLREQTGMKEDALKGDFIVDAKSYIRTYQDSSANVMSGPPPVMSIVWLTP